MRRQIVLASAVSGATPPCSLLLLCLNLLAEMRGVYSSSPSRPSTGVMPPNSKRTGGARDFQDLLNRMMDSCISLRKNGCFCGLKQNGTNLCSLMGPEWEPKRSDEAAKYEQ